MGEFLYNGKKTTFEVVRAFNRLRDKRSAHAKTKNRNITARDLLEFQSCARIIIMSETETGLAQMDMQRNRIRGSE